MRVCFAMSSSTVIFAPVGPPTSCQPRSWALSNWPHSQYTCKKDQAAHQTHRTKSALRGARSRLHSPLEGRVHVHLRHAAHMRTREPAVFPCSAPCVGTERQQGNCQEKGGRNEGLRWQLSKLQQAAVRLGRALEKSRTKSYLGTGWQALGRGLSLGIGCCHGALLELIGNSGTTFPLRPRSRRGQVRPAGAWRGAKQVAKCILCDPALI